MSLPAYIINREDLKQIIINGLMENGIHVEFEGTSGTPIDLDMDLEPLMNIINELSVEKDNQDIKVNEIFMEVMNLSIEMSSILNDRIAFINSISTTIGLIVEERTEIRNLTQRIKDVLTVKGNFQAIEITRAIGSMEGPFYINYTPTNDIVLHSLIISQNRFDYNDYWSLSIDRKVIFTNIHSKNTNEVKNFNVPKKINKGRNIQISFYNTSRRSKTLNIGLNFLNNT